MPMVSSGEDFGLLLSKWKNESAKVAVIGLLFDGLQRGQVELGKIRGSFVFLGHIAAVDMSKQSFSIATGKDDDNVFIQYANCQIVYGNEAEALIGAFDLVRRTRIYQFADKQIHHLYS